MHYIIAIAINLNFRYIISIYGIIIYAATRGYTIFKSVYPIVCILQSFQSYYISQPIYAYRNSSLTYIPCLYSISIFKQASILKFIVKCIYVQFKKDSTHSPTNMLLPQSIVGIVTQVLTRLQWHRMVLPTNPVLAKVPCKSLVWQCMIYTQLVPL